MCGRARCSLAREDVMTAAGVHEQRWHDMVRYRPSYNCSPGAWIPVIKLGPDDAKELQTMKWGLVPSFTRLGPGERPDHFRMFNARCESLAHKPVFRRLLPRRRCVVLLDGFYEWHSQGGGGGAASRKLPYHITTANGPQQPAMYLAGLYDVYHDPFNGELLHTFTIVTTDSSKPLAWLHDRMPVILTTQEEVSAWLGDVKAEGVGGAGGAAATKDAATKQEHAAAAADATLATPRERRQSSAPPAPLPCASLGGQSTLSSHGRSKGGGGGRRASGAASIASAGEGGAERKRSHDVAAVSDDDGEGDGDRGAGEAGDSDGDRCSHGKVGSSHEDSRAAHGRERDGKPLPSKGKNNSAAADNGVSEADKMRCEELVDRMCRPYGGPLLRWHPVTSEMSKPTYDKPNCCKDVRTKKGSIVSFFKPAGEGPSGVMVAAAGGSAAPPTGKAGKAETQPWKDDDRETAAVAVKDDVPAPETGACNHNPGECVVADGDDNTRTGGTKRPAETPVGGQDAPAKKKP